MASVNRNVLTLDEFRNKEMRSLPHATGELSSLLRDIGLAAKLINVEVNKAGLVDILGESGFSNIQGETVKKLDQFANDQFISVLERGVSCAGVASEEMDDFMAFEDPLCRSSKYICLFDPLDGSSNIDVNISIGTIFSVYRRASPVGEKVALADFLQPGRLQVAAGYIIYGSSTMLVYATRRGVNGFTLDPSIGEFCLSHPGIKCPANGNTWSVNMGNFLNFEKPVKQYIKGCLENSNTNGIQYAQRYTGSMVADMHRTLLKGGIFLYPATTDKPEGKLRLMYECNPFAFITEMAAGLATDGRARILDRAPQALHGRVPFFAGSSQMMIEWQPYMAGV